MTMSKRKAYDNPRWELAINYRSIKGLMKVLREHNQGKKKLKAMELFILFDKISSITFRMHKIRIENSGIEEIFTEYERLKGILRAGNFSGFNTITDISET